MPITLLPNIGFFKSLRPLDDARLSKQRQDALRILNGVLGVKGVPHHISQDGWVGYEYALGVYGMSACSLWQNERKNRDAIAFKIHEVLEGVPHDLVMPPWMEDLNFHRSHRSYLIRKSPEHYSSLWPNTPENMPLLWPQMLRDGVSYRLRLSATEERMLAAGERELPGWLEYDTSKREVIDLEEE